MLFKDFAQKLGFGDDIANVARGNNSELPRVGNVARKIDIALRYAVNDLFNDPDSKKKLLDACGLTRKPEDISYYLVDSVLMTPDKDWFHVRWIARIGEQNVDIAIFRLLTKEVDLCGKTIVFVEGAEFESGLADDMTDAMVAALKLHNEAGHDLFDRWCYGSDDWRADHLICPSCGSPIGAYSSEGRVVAGCNYCEWEPTKRYSYKYELANVENMKAERKKHRKHCQKVENHNKLQDSMMGVIKTFITAATHESPKGDIFYRYRRSIDDAVIMLQKAADQMDVKQKNQK